MTDNVSFKKVCAEDINEILWASSVLGKFEDEFSAHNVQVEPRSIIIERDYGYVTKELHLTASEHLWILMIDQEPVGYCLVDNHSDYFNRCLHIRSLFITKAHRGKGYAKKILDHVISQMRELDCTISRVSLNCLSMNNVAYKLYESYGFSQYTCTMIKELL